MKKPCFLKMVLMVIMPVFGCYKPLFCIFSFLFLFCFGSLEVLFWLLHANDWLISNSAFDSSTP